MSAPEQKPAPEHSLFIGNLSFKTTAEELGEFLRPKIAVKSVNIISRGRRSLGYGFVEVESVAAAQKGVEEFHQVEFGGRKINVEVARPPKPQSERPPRPPRQPKARAEGEAPKGDAPVRTQRRRQPKARAEGEAPKGDAPTRTQRPRRQRNSKNSGTEQTPRKERTSRKSATRSRISYEHAVFVANIPFSWTDDDLKSNLSTSAGAAVDARVARYGRRSKGFGFVQFENDAARDQSIKEKENSEVDGRTISVRAARQDPPESQSARRQARAEGDGPARTQRPRRQRNSKNSGTEQAPRKERTSRRSDPRPKMSFEHAAFVANIPFSWTDDDLKSNLSTSAGAAADARVARRFGRSKGYGFVQFENDAARDQSIKEKDNSEVDGRKMSVRVARQDPPQPAAK